jgi:hypothetical protein
LRFLADAKDDGAQSARRKYLHALEEGGATEARTRREYFDRYPIELLQNAHDACADAGMVGKARIVVTPHGLLVANQGRPFDAPRILSLVTQGLSEKATDRNKRHTIGYKGVGFSSVFQLTDQPQIASRQGFAFGFDRARAAELVRSTLGRKPRYVAARAFPFKMSPDDFGPDSQTVAGLLADGAETVVRLPLDRHGSDEVSRLVERTIRPETLLFMPALDELDCEWPGGGATWKKSGKRRRGIGRLISLTGAKGQRRTYLVATDHARLSKSAADSLEDPAWADVRSLNLAVAFPWDRGIDAGAGAMPIHVYFPTREATGRSLLFHADLYIETKRERVEMRGPAGALNERLADRLGRLAARLASSVAKEFSHELLCCLSTKERASEFGELLDEKLLDHLRDVRLVRSAGSRQPQRVARLARITDLERPDLAQGLASLVPSKNDLVLPQDDVGEASTVLTELGVEALDAEDVAARVDLTSESSPDEPLALLERWLRELPSWEASAAVAALMDRRVVRDASGQWQVPEEVVGSGAGAPTLPAALRRNEAAPLRSTLAKAFLRRIGIEALTPALALARLADALNDRSFGTTLFQQREAFRYAEALWAQSPSVLRDDAGRAGVIPVRVHNARRRRHQWRPGRDVYFGRDWSPQAHLIEKVYGPLGECEFLPGESFGSDRDKADRVAFFRALGVAEEPRWVRLHAPARGHVNRFNTWRALPDVREAADCGNDHPRADREVRGEVIDRLDALLDRASARGSGPLVELVTGLRPPFGPPAELRCTHHEHRGKAKWRQAAGYQRWRLSTAAWVPVASDPISRQALPPSRVWTGAPTSRKHPVLVPRVRAVRASGQLGLIRWTSPGRDALTAALADLQEGFPEPRQAAVQRTARELLNKLDALPSLAQVPRDMPILATRLGAPVWTSEPLIADIPAIGSLVDLPLVEPRLWPRLVRQLRLSRASSVIDQDVRAPDATWARPLLTRATRARLLALAKRAHAPAQAASRIAKLRERQTQRIEVDLRVADEAVGTIQPPFHLHQRIDARGRVLDADLFLSPAVLEHRGALGLALAAHLDTPEAAQGFALCLLDAAQAVEVAGLSEDEIASADATLKRQRYVDEDPFDDEGDPVPEPGERDESDRTGRTTGRGEPGSRVPEPEDSTYEKVKVSQRKSRTSRRRRPGKPRKPLKAQRSSVSSRHLTDDPSAEEHAIRHVVAYAERELGAKVADVQHLNRGWDLEFTHPDGTWQPVEVKGSKGRGPFVLTPNEVERAEEHANYAVYFVFGQKTRDPRIARIERFRDHVRKDDLVAMSWTLPTWADLPHDEISIRRVRTAPFQSH